MSYATRELYKVVAVAESGATKVVAESVGAFKATRLAKAVEARGFAAKVLPIGEAVPVVYSLKD